MATLFRDKYPGESRYIRLSLASAFLALGVGAFFGLLQAVKRTRILPEVMPDSAYYTSLTVHAVLLALVFSIFFLVAVFTWALVRSLDRGLPDFRIAKIWYGLMAGGSAIAGVTILAGFVGEIPLGADVLYTMYAPLQASPTFYGGLALFLIGTWVAGYDWFRTWWAWKQDNPGERIPLQTFMVLTTMIMWYLGTIGLAVEVVIFLFPWSLGILESINPLLTRTLFWYFGHMVVYFWLLPAYLLWYTVMPKLAGGRLFSDPLARVVFVLFLLLSTPVGIHHQYLDPGIAEGFKFIAMTNTMFLLLPSLLTAFTVVASIEHGARQRGGEGYFNWLRALPWGKPAFTGMALAGLMFAAGGFSGMINAGMNINYLVHNTIWIPGHFHLTVGTAAALTFMAGTYYLLPRLTGHEIIHRQWALGQVVLWFVGMTLMSNAMHRAGLAGVPRRTADPGYNTFGYESALGSIPELRAQIAIGGFLLFVSVVIFLVVVVRSWADRGQPSASADTLPAPLSGAEHGPAVLDNIALWTAIAVVLVILAYALPFVAIVQDGGLLGDGIRAAEAALTPVLGVGA